MAQLWRVSLTKAFPHYKKVSVLSKTLPKLRIDLAAYLVPPHKTNVLPKLNTKLDTKLNWTFELKGKIQWHSQALQIQYRLLPGTEYSHQTLV
jgi:hypothetical protein